MFLEQTLSSLVTQSLPPKKIIVVNDNSRDGTQEIIDNFTEEYPFVSGIKTNSSDQHLPGSKIINAFYAGFEQLDTEYDIICKFDADLIFPENYLESLSTLFTKNPECGIAGGFCAIQQRKAWKLENLTSRDHVRGALKAYRKACFKQIGGLRKSMGWDTVDELLARYHGWEVCTDESLHVKHLKPTAASYSEKAGLKQGEAFKKMRYGFILTLIASAKLALKKKSFSYFLKCINGYFSSDGGYIVTREEGKYIRQYRWKGIRRKFF